MCCSPPPPSQELLTVFRRSVRAFGNRVTRFYHQGVVLQDTRRSRSPLWKRGWHACGPTPKCCKARDASVSSPGSVWAPGWVCCDLYGRQPGQQPWVFQSHYLRYVHVLMSLLLVGPLFITYLQSASPHPWNKTFTLSMDSAYHRESISPMCTSVKHAW